MDKAKIRFTQNLFVSINQTTNKIIGFNLNMLILNNHILIIVSKKYLINYLLY